MVIFLGCSRFAYIASEVRSNTVYTQLHINRSPPPRGATVDIGNSELGVDCVDGFIPK